MFKEWLAEAEAKEDNNPTAMSLATADADGAICSHGAAEGFDERGFVFYTTSDSRKGSELAANPNASRASEVDDESSSR